VIDQLEGTPASECSLEVGRNSFIRIR